MTVLITALSDLHSKMKRSNRRITGGMKNVCEVSEKERYRCNIKKFFKPNSVKNMQCTMLYHPIFSVVLAVNLSTLKILEICTCTRRSFIKLC